MPIKKITSFDRSLNMCGVCATVLALYAHAIPYGTHHCPVCDKDTIFYELFPIQTNFKLVFRVKV